MTGFMMGNLLGTSRLVYALGRDGYLPRVFGRVTETHRVRGPRRRGPLDDVLAVLAEVRTAR